MKEEYLKYIQYEKRYSFHTITSYKNDLFQLQNFIESFYPDSKIIEANHAMLRDWIISLSERGLKESSINRKLVTLRSFFKFLLKRGVIEKNPTSKIYNLKTIKRLPNFIREDEMDLILEQEVFDDDFSGRRDQLTIELLYGTGIRINELIELKASNIDTFNNTIKVFGKRNKERIVPITHHLTILIKNYIFLKNEIFFSNGIEFLIVTNKGGKSYPMMINRIVKKHLQRASVDKKSPHILRHTYATHLLERGADLNAVKDLLGHESLAATQVYTHNTLGKLKKVFDQAHPKA